MNSDLATVFLWTLLGFTIGIFVMAIVFLNTAEHHDEIIKHGCAVYDSQTDNFKWTNNENK